jgi:hypothetical protein
VQFPVSESPWIEGGIGLVYEAEEHAQSFFRRGERQGMLGLGHLLLLVVGSWMAIFLLLNRATDI